ncbi:MAG: hypothetical protein AB7O96_00950 [Pseudobdellovibrionaceae bacterium]
MNYKITITKQVENPNYEEEKKSREYGFNSIAPQKYWEVEALKMDLEEDEFSAIRKACLEVMK